MASRRKVKLAVPALGDQEARAVANVVKSGMVTQGERVRKFERAMLDYLGARGHDRGALMVNSGSSANLLAAEFLANAAVGDKRYVITTALTWSTTVAPLLQHRLEPVFVDVGPDLTMDPEKAKAAVEDLEGNALALLPVHLVGHPADLHALSGLAQRHGLLLFEDCCEALGASWLGKSVGTWGDYASFSFYLSHHLNTVEGGLLVHGTRDTEAARSLREHGWVRDYALEQKSLLRAGHPELDDRWIFDRAGYNLRSTELNAAIGLLQLRRQEAWQRRRLAIANWYALNLPPNVFVHPYAAVQAAARPNPFSYPLIMAADCGFKRQDLMEWLERRGVETRPIMSGNITRHPWLARRGPPVALPTTDRVHEQGLLLPCHPHLERDDLVYLREAIVGFLKSRGLKEAS